jgi:hypothetical protein
MDRVKNEVTDQMKASALNSVRVQLVRSTYEILSREYGKEKGLDLTSEIFIDTSRKLLEPLVGTYEKNAKGATQMLRDAHQLQMCTGEIVESSPKRAVLREYKCACHGGWDLELCSRLSPDACDLICKMLNPKLKAYHTTYLNAGDDYCEIVFELED